MSNAAMNNPQVLKELNPATAQVIDPKSPLKYGK